MEGSITFTCQARREAFKEVEFYSKTVQKNAMSKEAARAWDNSIDVGFEYSSSAEATGFGSCSSSVSGHLNTKWAGSKSEAMSQSNESEKEKKTKITLHDNQALILIDLTYEVNFGKGSIKITETMKHDTCKFDDKIDLYAKAREYMQNMYGTKELCQHFKVFQIVKKGPDKVYPMDPARKKLPHGTVYYLTPSQKWPNYYVYAQKNSEGSLKLWNGKSGTGRQGEFIMRWYGQGNDQYAMLESNEWKGYYAYMQENAYGWCRLWSGDPGPAGHWLLTEHPHYPGYYWMQPKRWSTCYMYANADSNGNCKSWDSEPGSQGWWKFEST